MGQLDFKRIIVTGGASGIGAATVRAYVREGARVVSVDIADEAGKEIAEQAGQTATYMHCDVSDRQMVFDVFDRAVSRLGAGRAGECGRSRDWG